MAYKTSKTYITKNGNKTEYTKKNLLTVQLDDTDFELLEQLTRTGHLNTKAAVIRHLIRQASLNNN